MVMTGGYRGMVYEFTTPRFFPSKPPAPNCTQLRSQEGTLTPDPVLLGPATSWSSLRSTVSDSGAAVRGPWKNLKGWQLSGKIWWLNH